MNKEYKFVETDVLRFQTLKLAADPITNLDSVQEMVPVVKWDYFD